MKQGNTLAMIQRQAILSIRTESISLTGQDKIYR